MHNFPFFLAALKKEAGGDSEREREQERESEKKVKLERERIVKRCKERAGKRAL